MTGKKPAYVQELKLIPGARFPKGIILNRLTLPNGGQHTWESVRVASKSSAHVAGMTEARKLLLIRMFRFPVEDWVYELPGGYVEDDEEVIKAAERELLEETGYVAASQPYLLCRGWDSTSRTNGSFEIYFAERCVKIREPVRDAVEQYAEMTVVEQEIGVIVSAIARGDISYDTSVSHAIVAMRARSLI